MSDLRILVPFVDGMLRDEAVAALDAHAPGYELAELPKGDDLAYWRLIRDEWARPGSFVIVEQDVVLGADTLPAFRRCREPVCSARYELCDAAAFGCCRFRAEVKAKHPDLLAAIGPTPYRRLDFAIGQELIKRGYRLHDAHGYVGHTSATHDAWQAWLESWGAGAGYDGPAPLGIEEMARRIQALGLASPAQRNISTWLAIAAEAAKVLNEGSLGRTDMAIALFDTVQRPTWHQATEFVTAVVECYCPWVANLPDLHLVDRDVTVAEGRRRELEVANRGVAALGSKLRAVAGAWRDEH